MTATTQQPTSPQRIIQQTLASFWWLPLIRGIVLVIFGLLIFARPGATLIVLIQILGAYWLVGGVFDIVESIVGHAAQSRSWLIIGGILSVLAGFFMIGQPIIAGLMTGTFFVYLLGLMAVAAGLMQLFARREGGRSWKSLFLGILYILFGLILFANPLMTEIILLRLMSIWAIVTGVLAIAAAFSLRSLGKA